MPKSSPRRSTENARKRPSQRRSRETVRATVEAAARIFSQRGYAGATTNEIAQRAGVSIGTLYEYFPHKDALVRDLLDAHLADAERALASIDAAQLERALAAPLAQSVEQLVALTIALHAEQPGLHRVLFDEASRLPSVRRRAAQLDQRLTKLVASLLGSHPEARCSDPELSAQLVVRAVDALVHSWVARPSSAPPLAAGRLQAELVQLVLAYVGGRSVSRRRSGADMRSRRLPGR